MSVQVTRACEYLVLVSTGTAACPARNPPSCAAKVTHRHQQSAYVRTYVHACARAAAPGCQLVLLLLGCCLRDLLPAPSVRRPRSALQPAHEALAIDAPSLEPAQLQAVLRAMEAVHKRDGRSGGGAVHMHLICCTSSSHTHTWVVTGRRAAAALLHITY